ncbi:MAG TPA: HAD family hydrolase [Vicinamibacteria bacterium]|nr:HAD family hydrolase [Vicinamibacteria bacterium]
MPEHPPPPLDVPGDGLRAVLFDWDGTLVGSAEASYRCYERLFGEYGIAFGRDLFQSTYSPNWHRTYEALGLPPARWEEADARWLRHYSAERTRLLPGAREVLHQLKSAGLAVALVTSGDRRRVGAELVRLDVHLLFDSVTCADDTARRKPDPEPLLHGLRRLGVSPPVAAYVGDSPEDVEMARGARVYAVGVPGGFPNRAALVASAPDLLAPDLPAAAAALLGVAKEAPRLG